MEKEIDKKKNTEKSYIILIPHLHARLTKVMNGQTMKRKYVCMHTYL